jgi:predicted AlkP superfamily phosphohydrolase/phosphomutase
VKSFCPNLQTCHAESKAWLGVGSILKSMIDEAMSSPAKIIVIGLNSADRNLLLKWSDSGDLPVLESLRQKCVWGVLASPPAMGDDATWASFYTAVSPARHGRYFNNQIQPGTYAMSQFRDVHLKHEPFWNTFSRAGYRIVIIDVL